MKSRTLSIVLAFAVLALAPLAAQDAAATDTGSTSSDDVFNAEESVSKTTEQTQNAAPRDEILKAAVPWITGTYTAQVGFVWNWSDVWNSPFDLLNPTSYGLSLSTAEGDPVQVRLGFVARPDKDINVTGQVRASYPFVQQITMGSGPTAVTYTIPDFQVWSLYSKFNWHDALFFTFGKQPVRWGTGYFFSPADDIFAQSEVDITDPTAEREGPLALRVQYPIPRTMHNLYAYAVLPQSKDFSALASLKPEDIAVAGKAEFLFGNTEVALAGYYQRSQRPRAILMGTTGTGNLNFLAEGLAAFPSAQSEPYIEKTGPSTYTTVDRSGQMVYSATAGAMYTNADWNFTGVAQYLYNGYGYTSLSLGDILQAATTGAVSLSSLAGTLGGLGSIGQHYGVVYLGWKSLWDSKWDFSVLAIENFSDLSGYVKPTLSFTCFTYVVLSAGVSFSWGGNGTEFADPAGLMTALAAGTFSTFVAKPTMSLSLTASVGTVSF